MTSVREIEMDIPGGVAERADYAAVDCLYEHLLGYNLERNYLSRYASAFA